MVEKVNPAHPDKIADRIAGAVVDYCCTCYKNPDVNVDVIYRGKTYTVIVYSNVEVTEDVVKNIIHRITGDDVELNFLYNHTKEIKDLECDDSGVFEAFPMTCEEMEVSDLSRKIFEMIPFDGRYVLDESGNKLVVDQSRMRSNPIKEWLEYKYPHMDIIVNPCGEWGGENKSGRSNHRLDSDFGHTLFNKCIHGKDCSKVRVCVSIYAWLLAQSTGKPQRFKCNMGDTAIDGIPYKEIVETAREYIDLIGGYESLATWGLI